VSDPATLSQVLTAGCGFFVLPAGSTPGGLDMERNIGRNTVDEPLSELHEARLIHRVAAYAFLMNFCLAIMKAVLSFFSGSLAIAASAIDSGTDAVASLVIFGGVTLSSRKTRAFPMGLYKIENVASVVIAIFIFIAGYEIFREIFSPAGTPPRIALVYILLLFAGAVATLWFGQYALSIGRQTESPTLIAEGRHRQVDFLSSMVVLVSVTLSYFNVQLNFRGMTFDHMGAAFILFFIVRAGWGLLSDGMRVLLDASIDFPTLDRIRNIIQGEPLVSAIKSLTGRNAGRFRFIEATITIRTENLERAHQITEDIEIKIRSQIPHIEKVIIHYGPRERSHDRVAVPLDDEHGRVSAHFGEAPFFGIVHIRRKDQLIEKKKIVENPHRSVETAKGIRVAEWLIEQGVEHVGMKEDVSRRGPGYVLANGGVKMHIISAERLDQATREIIHREL
jgi:cation diffusion facilitator family transporter